jgi:drug/metabolite transporter (DMT)-like permease
VSSPRRRRLTGVALALVSAAGFGVMPVLGKVAYDDGAEPVGVLAVRFALAAAALLVLARLLGQPLPRDRRLGALALLGGVGYVGQALCYFFALERISAGLTSLLLYVFPALVVVLSALLLRERPRPLQAGCVALALAGTALTIGPVSGGQGSGVALGLGAALVYAVYIVASSRVTGVGAVAMAAVVLGAAAVTTGGLAAVARPALPSSATAWLALVGVALLGTVVAVTAFFGALALLGPSDAAVLSTVEPVVSVAVAGLVLGERLSSTQVAGGAVVLLAVAVLARAGSRAAQPEAVPA